MSSKFKSKNCDSDDIENEQTLQNHSLCVVRKAAKSYARLCWLGLKAIQDMAANSSVSLCSSL